jgi:hypothetical protein
MHLLSGSFYEMRISIQEDFGEIGVDRECPL